MKDMITLYGKGRESVIFHGASEDEYEITVTNDIDVVATVHLNECQIIALAEVLNNHFQL